LPQAIVFLAHPTGRENSSGTHRRLQIEGSVAELVRYALRIDLVEF